MGRTGPVPLGQRRFDLRAQASVVDRAERHESGYALPEGRTRHEKMVAMSGGPHLPNKNVYICFILALFMLAASPIRAADAATLVVRVDPHSGRLVRRPLTISPAAKKPVPVKTAPLAIANLVDQSARAHGVDPLLVHSVIQVESNYDPHAVSSKGAEGIMQLMPPTARMLGVGNTFDPAESIEAGVKYLKYLQDVYKDDRMALAAYNAGPGAVDKFKNVPPYMETQQYVERVGKRYGAAKAATPDRASEPAQQAASEPPQPQYPKLEHFVDENGRLHLTTAQQSSAQ